MNKDIERIKSWNPCTERLVWAEKQSSLKKVWDKCEDASWLFFICQAEKALNLKKEQSVAIAIAIANRVLDKYEAVCPDDKRPRKAIEAAQAWLDNPTKENVAAAYVASDAAYDAAYTAANAACVAVRAAVRAAAAAYAAAARAANAAAADAAYAAYAANAAAYAANAAASDAADVAADAVYHARATRAAYDTAVAGYAAAAERKVHADIFRSIVPNPFKQQTKE